MELVLTDKGRASLEKDLDYSIELPETHRNYLILIDQGVIGSGDHAFNSWEEFIKEYGTWGYAMVGDLIKQRYITIVDIPEEDTASFMRGFLDRRDVGKERRQALEPPQQDVAEFLTEQRNRKLRRDQDLEGPS